MPNQGFYQLVLPEGELTRDQWRELISRRELTVGHWLEKYTFQRLGQAKYRRFEGLEFGLWEKAGSQSLEILGAPGYTLDSKGIFRALQRLSPGEFEKLSPGLTRVEQPYHILGFMRNRKWVVFEIVPRGPLVHRIESVTAEESNVDRLVEEYSIDYYRIWAFLGKAMHELMERKQQEFQALQADVKEAEEERDFIYNLYHRVPLWW